MSSAASPGPRASPVAALAVEEAARSAVLAHAAEAYPLEACGVLLAATRVPESPVRRVVAAAPCPNDLKGDRRRGFVISAAELRRAEGAAAVRGRTVVGFYHSHPDRPPRPSSEDLANAWPWFSYLIASVRPRRRGAALAGFLLAPDRERFLRLPLLLGRDGLAPVGPTPTRSV